MWYGLIKQYWDVSIFRETPKETPYSWFLLIVIMLFYYALIMMQWRVAEVEKASQLHGTVFAGLSLILSYGLYTYALLFFFRLASRFVQTLTCLYAGHAIVHLFALPMLLLSPWFINANMAEPMMRFVGIMYLIATLMLTVWQFMVSVHIYKQALGVDYLAAILASFGLLATNILTITFWR